MTVPWAPQSVCVECEADIWQDEVGDWSDCNFGDTGRQCPEGPEIGYAGRRGPHRAEADR